MTPGTRVEITGIPFKGRTGVVRGKAKFGGLIPVYEIWCDFPDALGRQLVRVRPSEVRPYQEPPAPDATTSPEIRSQRAVTADFPPLDLLYLYRDRLGDILAAHDLSHPRVVGLAASVQNVPEGIAVELLVDALEARQRPAVDLHRAAEQIGQLIGHQVLLVHCPPGQEALLPGEQMRSL